ncbi:hypothetical protein HHL21_20805 [Massilia sp. RP-1-19]|uniref:Uncharacterized protein n=1 Tax=Massilia polaris TaxID=2728846 RepID=A0A848HQ55_9BURK|nr:hypothetical protein [Massilia polaris]NML63482.1 hypothetical protein [Massilia polaris]
MTVIELIQQLLPEGTDAFNSQAAPSTNLESCPSWPVDLFAVVGTIIERSGCYTMASPDRQKLDEHAIRLTEIANCARVWNANDDMVPGPVDSLWQAVVTTFSDVRVSAVREHTDLVQILLALFAIADEACAGMGWDVAPDNASLNMFASMAFAALTEADASVMLPHAPHSLCVMVPPDRAIVLPKAITSSVGCTIRSLSHYLALLAPISVLEPSWILSSKRLGGDQAQPAAPYDLRLLLIPFPFTIHGRSFQLSSPRQNLADNHVPAYFKLNQTWLTLDGQPLTGQLLADDLVIPLIKQAQMETGAVPTGVILPECALSSALAGELVQALAAAELGIEFLITGVLDSEAGENQLNRALTFVFQEDGHVAMGEQNKHHRWRLDRGQTDRYGLNFDNSPGNDKWWEDIDVSQRQLPFFGLRRDMSLATLICEDLARTDPAMSAIRAVGPNLVIALLMDGPQLAVRWPGRYATVLAEDPGSAVLSFTCAAMVDRSNWLEAKPARSIGLWRDGGGRTQEIGLPSGALAMMLTLESKKKHQNTLDNRSDKELSRQLTLRTVVPLFLADRPSWI